MDMGEKKPIGKKGYPYYFTHMTRGINDPEENAIRNPFMVLEDILKQGIIKASSRFICGGEYVTCFTELKIPEELKQYAQARARGRSTEDYYGVTVQKAYGMEQGLMRVKDLPYSEICKYKPQDRWKYKRKERYIDGYTEHNIDFSWEREWRKKGDFILSADYLILVKTVFERQYLRLCFELNSMNGYMHKPRLIMPFEEMVGVGNDGIAANESNISKRQFNKVIKALIKEGKRDSVFKILQTPHII